MGSIVLLLAGFVSITPDHHAAPAHAAHVHGEARLAIAIDSGGRLQAELDVPGDTVFGFEGEQQTDEDRQSVVQARARLSDGDAALQFNSDAGCRFLTAEIVGRDHDDAHSHTDVRVIYQFACNRPAALNRVATGLFEAFPRLEEIETVFLSPQRQEGFALTPAAPGRRLQR